MYVCIFFTISFIHSFIHCSIHTYIHTYIYIYIDICARFLRIYWFIFWFCWFVLLYYKKNIYIYIINALICRTIIIKNISNVSYSYNCNNLLIYYKTICEKKNNLLIRMLFNFYFYSFGCRLFE